MERELIVFARKEELLTPDEIVAALGLEFEWLAVPRGGKVHDNWDEGLVRLVDGRDHAGVTLGNEELADAERDYLATVTEAGKHVAALAESRQQYRLTVKGSPSVEQTRVLNALARAIARAADGVIYDSGTETYYDGKTLPRPGGGKTAKGRAR